VVVRARRCHDLAGRDLYASSAVFYAKPAVTFAKSPPRRRDNGPCQQIITLLGHL